MKYTRDDLLKDMVRPIKTSRDFKVKDYLESLQCYTSRNLKKAYHIFKKMLEEDLTILCSISGAMIPAGLGGTFCDMIKRGQIDVISTTDANLYHDFHIALGYPFYKCSPFIDDKKLRKSKLVRVYDLLADEYEMEEADQIMREKIFPEIGKKYTFPISTATFNHALGSELKKHIKNKENLENSLLVQAAEFDVPIFVPASSDGSIALNRADYNRFKKTEHKIKIDPDLDVEESAALARYGDIGIVIIGGGPAKNFLLQTQPFAEQILYLKQKGYKRFVQITTDIPDYGSLTGATPQEAYSWGKMHRKFDAAVVRCDATIALPLIANGVTDIEKKHKRLFKKIPKLVKRLHKEANFGKRERIYKF